MRYIIIGAGAVGGTIGGCLFQGGHDVVLVARGAHLDTLRAHGLRLATPAGTYQLAIPAVGGPDEADLRDRARAEALAVFAAAGIGYASEEEITAARGDQVRVSEVNGSTRAGGSSWQSLSRGTGTIEADFLNGEIVLLGRENGVPAPVNATLQRLANQAAHGRKAPGSIAPAEILSLAAEGSLP
jgi:2-dehydropantoate 2-reductase